MEHNQSTKLLEFRLEVSEYLGGTVLSCHFAVRRFLEGPEIPERQLYREPPDAFLEADYLEVGRVGG